MFTATITFIFVVLGTFITRSGLVQSVHAFAEDPVSTYFFLAIMVASGLAFLLGLLYRHGEIGEDDDQIESMLSKNGSYYLTNIIMVMAGALVAYLRCRAPFPHGCRWAAPWSRRVRITPWRGGRRRGAYCSWLCVRSLVGARRRALRFGGICAVRLRWPPAFLWPDLCSLGRS